MTLYFVSTDTDRRDFDDWLSRRQGILGIDTETSGLDPWHEDLRMVQASDGQDAWALPFPEERAEVGRLLGSGRKFVGHRAKFDAHFLERHALPHDALVHDTKIVCHLLDSANSTSLKPSVARYLDIPPDPQADLKEAMRKNKWKWATVPKDFDLYWQYAAFDALITAKLWEHLHRKVLTGPLASVYSLESDVWRIIMQAEETGMLLDSAYVEGVCQQLERGIDKLRQRWKEINLNSGQQIAERIYAGTDPHFSRLLTPTGNWKTDKETLEGQDHPLARDVLLYRGLNKQLSTYYLNFNMLQDDWGRVHPTINTIGPRTGRMSCERPNLQNVPIREGSTVRNSFVAAPGHVFVAADYSQIEYRLMACLSGEAAMMESFRQGKDFHEETARTILGREPTTEERYTAKTANFAMLYGAGPTKLAKVAGISPQEAKQFMQAYRSTFPKAGRLIDSVARHVKDSAKITGRETYDVETAYGRRVPVDQDRSYAALNYLIQGTAADVLKRAICVIGQDSRLRGCFRLPIHDELLFEVPRAEAADVSAALSRLMEVGDFDVPLTVTVKQGERWGSLK